MMPGKHNLPLEPYFCLDARTCSCDSPVFSETPKCCSTSSGEYRNECSMVARKHSSDDTEYRDRME